jgi:hypothetical protein
LCALTTLDETRLGIIAQHIAGPEASAARDVALAHDLGVLSAKDGMRLCRKDRLA